MAYFVLNCHQATAHWLTQLQFCETLPNSLIFAISTLILELTVTLYTSSDVEYSIN